MFEKTARFLDGPVPVISDTFDKENKLMGNSLWFSCPGESTDCVFREGSPDGSYCKWTHPYSQICNNKEAIGMAARSLQGLAGDILRRLDDDVMGT